MILQHLVKLLKLSLGTLTLENIDDFPIISSRMWKGILNPETFFIIFDPANIESPPSYNYFNEDFSIDSYYYDWLGNYFQPVGGVVVGGEGKLSPAHYLTNGWN